MAIPTAASSSSACTTAKFFAPVSGSTRSRAQWLAKASTSEVEGVMGYQAGHRRPRVDAAEGGRGVAVDEDPVTGRLAPAHPDPDGAVEVLAHPLAAEL